jgi:hypothetical protein
MEAVMADGLNNGLGDTRRLKQSSLRQAIATTVAANRNGWSEAEMAEEWGVSKGTVNNAQNKSHDLGLMNWLKLGERFGPAGLNTVLALVGMKAVRDDQCVIDCAVVPVEIAQCLPLLIELLADGDCSDADVRRLEQAGIIGTLARTSDLLRQRRDTVRLREVV